LKTSSRSTDRPFADGVASIELIRASASKSFLSRRSLSSSLERDLFEPPLVLAECEANPVPDRAPSLSRRQRTLLAEAPDKVGVVEGEHPFDGLVARVRQRKNVLFAEPRARRIFENRACFQGFRIFDHVGSDVYAGNLHVYGRPRACKAMASPRPPARPPACVRVLRNLVENHTISTPPL
jgi:hypothetical protein